MILVDSGDAATNAVVLLVVLLAAFSAARILWAWWDSRALRKAEQLNGMRWRWMR